jgi:6-phosphogluconolactonase (cycloisomerase 2 family)
VANLGGLPTDPRGISAYTIDITTGALTEISGSPFTLLRSLSVTVDPSGRFAYAVATGGVQALTIDSSTGALTAVGGLAGAGTSPQFVTVDPTGKFAYVPNSGAATLSAYTIDATSGALTRIDADGNPANGIQDFPAGGGPSSVAVHPSGKFAYVANAADDIIQAFTINAATGALTDIFVAGGDCSTVPGGNCLTGDAPRFVSVDRGGKFLYVTNVGTDDVSIYTIDAATGALTEIPTGRVLAGDGPSAIGIVGTTP